MIYDLSLPYWATYAFSWYVLGRFLGAMMSERRTK